MITFLHVIWDCWYSLSGRANEGDHDSLKLPYAHTSKVTHTHPQTHRHTHTYTHTPQMPLKIYCHKMASSQPLEYLTFVRKDENFVTWNFAWSVPPISVYFGNNSWSMHVFSRVKHCWMLCCMDVHYIYVWICACNSCLCVNTCISISTVHVCISNIYIYIYIYIHACIHMYMSALYIHVSALHMLIPCICTHANTAIAYARNKLTAYIQVCIHIHTFWQSPCRHQ
jgi:hypothetical protein